MVTDLLLLPPLLVAEQVKVVPEVSAVTEIAPHPFVALTTDSASVTVQVKFTSLVYQPLLPSVPVIDGVITGGVVSATM
jgi:hypothetical protein